VSEALKALTANDLVSGEVVFRGADGWSASFAEAVIYEAADVADAALEEARAAVNQLADPYLIDVAAVDGFPVPTSYRERIRALGPSIHPDMGKQAVGGALVAALQAAHGAARSSGRLGLIRRR
jgi:sulfite reductase (NADPH) hemoprotein beta-component